MSTNYYLHINACPTCRCSKKILHIGKRSAGWPFGWRGYRHHLYKDIESVEEWMPLLTDPKNSIVNEYDEVISAKDFLDMVEEWDTEFVSPTRPQGFLRFHEFS